MKKTILAGLALLISIFFMGCPEKKSAEMPAPATVQGSTSVSSEYAIKTKRASDAVKAADFSLPDLKGGKVSLADYKDKIIILDFWATWCPPCKAEIPGFIKLQAKYGKDGVVFIGAAIDDPNKVKPFMKSYGINYPVCIADQATSTNYGGIRGIPTTFVIDREGYIAREYVGFRPEEQFEQDIKDLM